MRMKILGAAIAILAGAGLLMLESMPIGAKTAMTEQEMDKKLNAREVQIDPAELVDLIYNFNTALRIFDVRDEADYNLFHIIDAQFTSMEDVKDPKWVAELPQQTVIVLVSNDEARATEAWKLLSAQGVDNLYILEGGINRWLGLFDSDSNRRQDMMQPVHEPAGDDILGYRFANALGGNRSASDPDPAHFPDREYEKKVKPIGPTSKKAGGCG